MKYYIDFEGVYLGGWDRLPPIESIEVPFPPENARQIWDFDLLIWGPYTASEPPHLNNGGLVRFTGTAPSTVLEGIRMIGVTRIAKGRYRGAHEVPMPSDQYTAIPSVLDTRVLIPRITARTADYVEVRVTDLSGVAQDPAEVSIKTERVIYS